MEDGFLAFAMLTIFALLGLVELIYRPVRWWLTGVPSGWVCWVRTPWERMQGMARALNSWSGLPARHRPGMPSSGEDVGELPTFSQAALPPDVTLVKVREDELRALIAQSQRLREENQYLRAMLTRHGLEAALPGSAAPATGDEPALLPLRRWLDLVNEEPDQFPHLFLEGGSGVGKTLLATAILHDRRGQVAVIGVKSDDSARWGAGYIFQSEERERALSALLQEARRRVEGADRSGLTIVLDDATRLCAESRTAVELYKYVADVGRAARVRLIFIARGRLVRGIEGMGESDLRRHFIFISLQRVAFERAPRATLEIAVDDVYRIDVSRVAAFAEPIPVSRWWQPAQERERTPDERSSVEASDVVVPFPSRNDTVVIAGVSFTPAEIAQLITRIAAGQETMSQIVTSMPRYQAKRHRVFRDVYDQLEGAVREAQAGIADIAVSSP